MNDNRGFLTLNEYQELAFATNKNTTLYVCHDGDLGDFEAVDGAYNAMGMAGEAGECLDKIKKAARDGVSADNYANYREEVGKEIGDVLWYISQLAADFDFSLEQIAQLNLKKLADRRARNVLSGAGDNR